MAFKSVVKTLTDYFNTGEGKRPVSAWNTELKAFTPEERRAFAEEVASVTGDTVS